MFMIAPIISVIIPTRNRELLLQSLVERLTSQTTLPNEIIIVDSSDKPKTAYLKMNSQIDYKYIHTKIKSAAIQRNIGLKNLNLNSNFVFFLDDDVVPEPGYISNLMKHLNNEANVGVSGIAVNPNLKELRTYPYGLIGIFQKIFCLDSNHDGKLLKSGINIPLRDLAQNPINVEWLIGCSAWRREYIGDTSFEVDFYGQSLAEDVIFSYLMSAKGNLLVDPSIVLSHLESEIGRPNEIDFWSMWMTNRWRLIKIDAGENLSRVLFWWATIGQLIILFYGIFENRQKSFSSIKGIIIGSFRIIFGSK